jgi:hypothetical protein
MSKVEINSKLIKYMEYEKSRILYIRFTDGRLLAYSAVPQEVYDEFLKAETPDEFYNMRIVSTFSFSRTG